MGRLDGPPWVEVLKEHAKEYEQSGWELVPFVRAETAGPVGADAVERVVIALNDEAIVARLDVGTKKFVPLERVAEIAIAAMSPVPSPPDGEQRDGGDPGLHGREPRDGVASPGALHDPEPVTISGTPLDPDEVFPCDPPQDGCRLCNWPFDDGYYCRRAGRIVRQQDNEVSGAGVLARYWSIICAYADALAWIADAERAETADPLTWATEAHERAREALGFKDVSEPPGPSQQAPADASPRRCATCPSPATHFGLPVPEDEGGGTVDLCDSCEEHCRADA